MIRSRYQRLMDQVEPGERLVQTVLEKRERRGRTLRPAVLALAACLCLVLAVPALAARSEEVYAALYAVSPATAQFFRPVHLTAEDNGIQMEVVSAYIHENAAEIYIALRDLIGERVDETTDLFESYSIRCPFDSSAGCHLAGYDGDTGTAYFLIQLEGWGGRSVQGEKITFSVKEFLSGKQIYEDLELPFDLSAAAQGEPVQAANIIGGGGDGCAAFAEGQTPDVLRPGEPLDGFPVEGIDLTGIGYIDGRLHIQTAVTDRLDNDNHGYFYLKNEGGDTVRCSYNLYFFDQNVPEGRTDYCEYVFDVPQAELGQYTLYGCFVTCGQKTEGNWSVTFPLELKNK